MTRPPMHIVRYLDADGGARVGLAVGPHVYSLSGARTVADVLSESAEHVLNRCRQASDGTPVTRLEDVELLPPVDERMEVWAAGVTYERSREARVEESESASDVYDRVYDAERPELFFKSVAWRVVGHQGLVTIRRDSSINIPEPEIALVANRFGELIGITICNDMSSRSIEGENPLYLPQAKMWLGSCSVGPWITLTDSISDLYALEVGITVERAGRSVFTGSTNSSRLHRRFDELLGFLFREDEFPDGVVLSTGTGIVPDMDFTLAEGDHIKISVEHVGELRNHVRLGKDTISDRFGSIASSVWAS